MPAGGHNKGQTSWSKDDFLAALESGGTIADACRVVEISRSTAYRAKEADPEFSAKWDENDQRVIDDLERVAFKRATEGSDRLIEFLLRAKKPDVYRERLSIEDERKREERERTRKLSDDELDEKLAGLGDENVIEIETARKRGRRSV